MPSMKRGEAAASQNAAEGDESSVESTSSSATCGESSPERDLRYVDTAFIEKPKMTKPLTSSTLDPTAGSFKFSVNDTDSPIHRMREDE